MEELLREVLAEDKSLLCRRDELIAALEEKVPNDLRRDFASVKKAISLNVGEKFFVGDDADRETTKTEVAKILKDGGLQEARINFVINTFVKALDWDKPKIPVLPVKTFEPEKTDVPPAKVNIVKAVPEKISVPVEAEESIETEKSIAVVETQKPPQQSPATETVQPPRPPVEETPRQNHLRQPQAQTYRNLPQNHKSKLFTTEGRLNRLAYFLQSLKVFGLAVVGGILLEFLIGIPILIATMVANWMIIIRRLHDLNKSGWWSLIALIPYVNVIFGLYLLFAPGTKGDNRYGADPLTE